MEYGGMRGAHLRWSLAEPEGRPFIQPAADDHHAFHEDAKPGDLTVQLGTRRFNSSNPVLDEDEFLFRSPLDSQHHETQIVRAHVVLLVTSPRQVVSRAEQHVLTFPGERRVGALRGLARVPRRPRERAMDWTL